MKTFKCGKTFKCELCGKEHYISAYNTAQVIMNGQSQIMTYFGWKRVCGITSLIEIQMDTVLAEYDLAAQEACQ